MKKVILCLVVALTVIALLAAPVMAAGKNGPKVKAHVDHLYLYEKDPGDWSIVEDGSWGKFNYKLTGEGAETTVSGVFNGKHLEVGANYTLIYYPEVAPNPWPAGGVPVVIIGESTANDEGNVHIAGAAVIGEPDDQPAIGDYVGQTGDKIWLVKTDDITSGNLTGWNPAEYLFESELINTD